MPPPIAPPIASPAEPSVFDVQPSTSPRRRSPSRRQQPANGVNVAVVVVVIALLLVGGIVALVFVAIDQSEKADEYMEYVQNKEREALERKEARLKKFTEDYIRQTEAQGRRPSSIGGAGDSVEVAGLKASISGNREKVPSLSHSSVYNQEKDETTVLTAETPVDVRLGARQIIVQVGFIHPGRTMESRRDVTGVILVSGDLDGLKDKSMTIKFDGQTMLLRNAGERASKIVFNLTKKEMRDLAQSVEISVEFGRVSFDFASEHMRLLEQVRVIE